MAHRIEVTLKDGLRDPAGEKVRRRAGHDLGVGGITRVRVVEAYNIDGDLSQDELALLAREPFSDRVIQTWAVDRPVVKGFALEIQGVGGSSPNGTAAPRPWAFDWAIEVGLLPGVTDNVGRTATEAVEVCVPRVAGACHVYTSRLYSSRRCLPHRRGEDRL